MTSPETNTPTSTPAIDPTRNPLDDEIDVYGLTHTGKIRKVNQDHFMICSLSKLIGFISRACRMSTSDNISIIVGRVIHKDK